MMLVIDYGWQLLALMMTGAALVKAGWLKGILLILIITIIVYWAIPLAIFM